MAAERQKTREILIFGGTTEGRKIADFCALHAIPAFVSVFSKYGADMLDVESLTKSEASCLEILTGAMDQEAIERFLRENNIRLVIDATHPFAKNVSENIRKAMEKSSAALIRVLRGEDLSADGEKPDAVTFPDAASAASYLAKTEGNILLTTGSRTLADYASIPDAAERLYARVLPSTDGIQACTENGLKGRHIIAMQGPFSAEMNMAQIREISAKFLVTKESGNAGGFREKMAAVKRCGITAVVIGRSEEDGISLSQCLGILRERYGTGRITIAGIGPGSSDQMTLGVLEAIRQSDLVIGASRMLDCAKSAMKRLDGDREDLRTYLAEYRPAEVIRRIEEAGGKRIVLLFSGSVAFHSGAVTCGKALSERGIPYTVLPGISSVSYLASKMGLDLADFQTVSMHGTGDSAKLLMNSLMESGSKGAFILAGEADDAVKIARALAEAGCSSAKITVGENLSAADEKITGFTAEKLVNENERTFARLAVIAVER